MVFQDPSSSLHPLYRVGWQIVEAIRAHSPMSRGPYLSGTPRSPRPLGGRKYGIGQRISSVTLSIRLRLPLLLSA
jgi:ABC-type dipeptide/oligopeptide/nickel transport system ATPase component